MAEIAREEPVDYAREVFPVLKKNCLACHNSTKAKSGLNMETPALMIEGGDSGTALVPGDPAESWVFLSAAMVEMMEESMPPERSVQVGTSARRCALMESGMMFLVWIIMLIFEYRIAYQHPRINQRVHQFESMVFFLIC